MANPQFVYHMNRLSKTYPGGKQVLKDINLSFYPGAKIGVVGVNGSGKSTLLKIMAGELPEFQGEAWPADGISVGYLSQEPPLNPDKDVLGNVTEGLPGRRHCSTGITSLPQTANSVSVGRILPECSILSFGMIHAVRAISERFLKRRPAHR